MDLRVARAVLHAKHHKFLELLKDLHRCEPRVVSLQEAADQLELQVTSQENSRTDRLTDETTSYGHQINHGKVHKF